MTSRVVHIRLDDWVLLGCHDILKTAGQNVANIPMSTVVREVITAFIRKMQQGEHIPAYSVDELAERIQELSLGELDVPEIEVDSLFSEASPQPEDLSGLASEVLRRIQAESEPAAVAQPVELSEPSIEVEENPTIDLFQIPCEPFSEIVKRAPKDRIIEIAEQGDSDIFQQAVAITYSNLPESQWGSKEAEENISNLVRMHLPKNDKS